MVAEAVAFCPVVDVAFNPTLKRGYVRGFEAIEVAWKPIGNDDRLPRGSLSCRVPRINGKFLVYLRFDLGPIFFCDFSNSCGFDSVDFDVFFEEMLSGLFCMFIDVGLEVRSYLGENSAHNRRGIAQKI